MEDVASRPVTVGVIEGRPATLDHARAEAERAGCGIRLVHAYTVPPTALGSLYGIDIPESYRLAGEDILAEAQRHLVEDGFTGHVDTVVKRGFAPSVLEDESRTSRVVMIGPDESKPWYIRLFEGTVARHLVEHAGCPVVVVPESSQEPATDAPVVVMVDDVASARGPLTFAFEAASARRAELRVLHVAPAAEKEAPADGPESVRRAVQPWFDRHPDVRGVIHLASGDVHREAARAAHGTGLLVVGRTPDHREPSLRTESVAREIISASDCPVAVVPDDFGA